MNYPVGIIVSLSGGRHVEVFLKRSSFMAEKVIIDEDECIGCESCAEICPEVFGFDENTEKAFVNDDAKAPLPDVENTHTT